MDTDLLIRDYLSRLEAAASPLPVQRRAELAAEVRDHIDAALAEAGRSDEVTVRNILERLGSPEEIVAGEAAQAGSPGGAAVASTAGLIGARSRLGAVEVAALLLLPLAPVALLIPFFGPLLWLGSTVVGLVLVSISSVWSLRRKLILIGIAVAFYAFVFAGTLAARGPQAGEGPSVIVTPGE